MLRVLSITSEAFPLIKTGGLADVAGALPLAMPREGVEMRTLLPGYPAVMSKISGAEAVHAYPTLAGGAARVTGASSVSCGRCGWRGGGRWMAGGEARVAEKPLMLQVNPVGHPCLPVSRTRTG